MKNIIAVLTVLYCFSMINAQIINRAAQPAFAERCSTSQFNNTDSVCIAMIRDKIVPWSGHSVGDLINCKGLMISPGSDSAIVFVHPILNASTFRFPIKLYGGIPIPFMFDKIWKIGTTCSLDSIWMLPDVN
jgi:hypothetical protein